MEEDKSGSDSGLQSAPRNPSYGSGIFRRRIRLVNQDHCVVAELEDGSHGFRSTITHDGSHITAIEGETIRYPMTTCAGAVEPLKKFIGVALGLPASTLSSSINPRQQCTHLFDLSVWAYRHIQRNEKEVIFDIVIPDENGSDQPLTVFKNGEVVLEWRVSDWVVRSPDELNGKTLHSGFSKWLEKIYGNDEDAKEYAWLAQKGYLVSFARVYDVNKLAGTQEFTNPNMKGVCHTYSESQMPNAYHTVNSFRDFTNSPEQLLKFE